MLKKGHPDAKIIILNTFKWLRQKKDEGFSSIPINNVLKFVVDMTDRSSNNTNNTMMKGSSTSVTIESPKSSVQPTPPDLDRFIPWMFMELQSSQMVAVRRVKLEECPPKNIVKSTVSRASLKCKPTVDPFLIDSGTSVPEDTIKLTAYHNTAGRVVEIAIDSASRINSKLIETISLCLPFHPMLRKLTCKGKAPDYTVIHEIANMLPFSNITDVCLDNSFVPQGNYYALLDQISELKYLSLSKCRINDEVCMKISERLEFGRPASKSLRALNLSFNSITDVGAQALGHSLRTNRHILHINLCNNNITNVGVEYLLEPLSEFPLTSDEVRARFRSRWEYCKKKAVELKQQSPQSTSIDLSNDTQNNQERKGSLKKQSKSESMTGTELKTREDYVFGLSNTVFKNGRWFADGNLIVLSLNLGYNCLDYTCLSKIIGVLSYQKNQERGPGRTGLLRIVIEGNHLPVKCEEYSTINTCLNLNTSEKKVKSSRKKQESSQRSRHSTVQMVTPNTDARSLETMSFHSASLRIN